MTAPTASKGQYGLIIKKKPNLLAPTGGLNALVEKAEQKKQTTVFGDDDDDDSATKNKADTDIHRSAKPSASTLRSIKQAEREHERALAEDPNAFDYDSVYDQMQAQKHAKNAKDKAADKQKEPKYAHALMKAKNRREIEEASRDARMQEKERIKEGEQFAEKESFVTGAYRKQMEDIEQLRKEEAEEHIFNQMTDVQKQKLWQQGFNRYMLNELSRDGDPSMLNKGKKMEEGEETKSEKKNQEEPKKKEKSYRRREESASSSDEEDKSGKKNKKTNEPRTDKSRQRKEDGPQSSEKPTKSSAPSKYSDDRKQPKKTTDTIGQSDTDKPKPIKTRAEEVAERRFTPSPQASDAELDEEADQTAKDEAAIRRRLYNQKAKLQRAEAVQQAATGEKKKARLDRLNYEERLAKLKLFFARRNTEEQLNEARKRYFDRKANGTVENKI